MGEGLVEEDGVGMVRNEMVRSEVAADQFF